MEHRHHSLRDRRDHVQKKLLPRRCGPAPELWGRAVSAVLAAQVRRDGFEDAPSLLREHPRTAEPGVPVLDLWVDEIRHQSHRTILVVVQMPYRLEDLSLLVIFNAGKAAPVKWIAFLVYTNTFMHLSCMSCTQRRPHKPTCPCWSTSGGQNSPLRLQTCLRTLECGTREPKGQSTWTTCTGS